MVENGANGKRVTIPEISESSDGKLYIPHVEENSGNYRLFSKIDFNGSPLRGRPSKVVLKFLDFGIKRRWFEPKHIYKLLIWFGFDNYYIDDVFLLKVTLEYAYKDKFLTKKQRLKGLEEGDGDYDI